MPARCSRVLSRDVVAGSAQFGARRPAALMWFRMNVSSAKSCLRSSAAHSASLAARAASMVARSPAEMPLEGGFTGESWGEKLPELAGDAMGRDCMVAGFLVETGTAKLKG